MTEEEKIKKEIEEKINKANIPLRLRKESIDTFIATTDDQKKIKEEAIKFINAYADKSTCPAGLIFVGEHFTGKSHLACAILQEMIKRYGITGEVVDRDGFFPYGKNKVPLDLVVIDNSIHSHEEKCVGNLMLMRYDNMKSTILVCNELPSFLSLEKGIMEKFEHAGGKILTFKTKYKSEKPVALRKVK